MPWCDDCDRFWNPSTLTGEGACPTCGRAIARTAVADDEEDLKAPWHFKILVVLVVLYLGWRVVELVAWIF